MVELFVRDSKTVTMWIVLLVAFFLAAVALTGCGAGRPDAAEETAKAVEPVATEPVTEEPVAEVEAPPVDVAEAVAQETIAEAAEPTVEERSVEVVALLEAREGQGQAPAGLIVGLDGAEYPAYAEDLILEVKRALTDIELYRGALDGVLDDTTMAAIARFQQMNELHLSGVPSPQTRELLTTRHAKGSEGQTPSSG